MYNKKMILGLVGFVFLCPPNFSSYSRWKYHSLSCINTLDNGWLPLPTWSCGGGGAEETGS